MPTARFVILHHRAPQGEHWDLMIEQGGRLATWQLLADPRKADSWPIPARRIGDHRLAYLTYEGPLSGERGDVTRVDEGECTWPAGTEIEDGFHLSGGITTGRFGWSIEPAFQEAGLTWLRRV